MTQTAIDDAVRRILALERRIRDFEAQDQRTLIAHARPLDGTSFRLGLIRGVLDPDDVFVELTYGRVLNAAPWLEFPDNEKHVVRTEPGTFARHYDQWVWAGAPDPSLPIALDRDVHYPIPVVRIDGTAVVLHYSRYFMVDDLPATIPQTEGGYVNSGGNLSFTIVPL